ncbi:hypothetical protein NQ317_010197 [Molorchus minor]|uniref:Uncharacterized protein n=1 Tax=Molorchus minor TaxID=1323400 RepID=A0ABQ9J9X5_9CUCU|nr:hypothetical protein NQ317_010197 [Molorchus minor]
METARLLTLHLTLAVLHLWQIVAELRIPLISSVFFITRPKKLLEILRLFPNKNSLSCLLKNVGFVTLEIFAAQRRNATLTTIYSSDYSTGTQQTVLRMGSRWDQEDFLIESCIALDSPAKEILSRIPLNI